MVKIAALISLMLFVGYMIVAITYLWKTHGFFKYLKENDQRTWEKIGKPHLILNNTPIHTFKFMKFLFKNQYLELPHTITIEKAYTLKKLFKKSLIVFLVMVMLILVVFFNA